MSTETYVAFLGITATSIASFIAGKFMLKAKRIETAAANATPLTNAQAWEILHKAMTLDMEEMRNRLVIAEANGGLLNAVQARLSISEASERACQARLTAVEARLVVLEAKPKRPSRKSSQ